jgi:hypothetical protein
MTRFWKSLLAGVLSLVVGAVPAFADQSCKPVVGHFEAVTVPPGTGHCPDFDEAFCTAGRVWGGIQGTYQFVITGALPASAIGGEPGVLFFVGESLIFLKSGDQLFGKDTGSIDVLLPTSLGGFASLITFHGGTGSAATASGQIRLRGEFDPTEGTTSGDYIGTLCTQ